MTYTDHGTGNETTDEDVAIAMTGYPGITVEVGLAMVTLINTGVLEPIWKPKEQSRG